MNAEEAVQYILTHSAAFSALIPPARVTVPGVWSQLNRPYAVHFPVSTRPLVTHQKLAARKIDYYQVSIFSDSYSLGDQAMQAAIQALHGPHIIGSPEEGWCFVHEPGPHYIGWDLPAEVHHFAANFTVLESL